MKVHIKLAASVATAIFLPIMSLSAQGFTDMDAARNFIHPGGPNLSAKSVGKLTADTHASETFHNGLTLSCSQCHVMHASKQHVNNSEAGVDPFGPYPQSFTPAKSLLKASDPVALCLACHDNFPGIPDVVGADVNGLTERSAGFFDLPGVNNPRGHKLDYGLTLDNSELCYRCHFVGTFATAAVSCIDCHNPHGNYKVRNLQWASWPGGEPDFGLYENGAASLAKYERSNIAYGDPGVANVREVTNMCNDCHHVFTGSYYNDPDGNGWHNLHPSYDSERGNTNSISQGLPRATTDPAHWTGGTGVGFMISARVPYVNHLAADFASAKVVDPTVNGVFCLSCHKAHGGSNSFGLVWDPVSGTAAEGCDQCHAKSAL